MKRMLILGLCIAISALLGSCSRSPSVKDGEITMENKYLRFVFGEKGEILSFYDKEGAAEYALKDSPDHFAYILRKKGGEKEYPEKISVGGRTIILTFAAPAVTIKLDTVIADDYMTFEVADVSGSEIYKLAFACASLGIDYKKSGFGASVLSLKMNTDTADLPGNINILGAFCYERTGLKGARAAIIGAPEAQMRDAMKAAIKTVKKGEMPVSEAGGPWAQEAKGSDGSYIIETGLPDISQADALIENYKTLNIDQVDFHQGAAFRQGDFVFNYQNGIADFKAFTDKLHENGLQAGLHTYAQFIDPAAEYITPVPHKDLDALAYYTLTADIAADSSGDIAVKENTSGVTTTTGFFVRNSVYIQIDNEIISFSGAGANGFTGVARGALGTTPAAHAKGAKVKHLSQFFNMFMPALDSELFLEIARKTAGAYNEGGFDMIYLDALDGTYSMVDDVDFAWYYCGLFVNEILKYTDKPPLMEYSCMPNTLWYARSRMGALDTPITGYREFIEMHCMYNEQNAHSRMLSSQLGWISMYPPSIVSEDLPGFQAKYMFPEDVDYLGSRAIAYNSGLSYLGTSEDKRLGYPALAKNTERIALYDELRKSNYFGKAIMDKLKEPRADFRLEKEGDKYFFRRMNYEKTKLCFKASAELRLNNPYDLQKPGLRIEALHALASPYNAPENLTLLRFDENKPITGQALKAEFAPVSVPQGLGVWVYGNGRGAYLKIRLQSPKHIAAGFAERTVKVDFTGWRYFELVETDNGEIPKARDNSAISIIEFREQPNFKEISSISVSVAGDAEGIRLRDIKAIMPVFAYSCFIENPSISVNGEKITFGCSLYNGQYLEYAPGASSAVVYDASGIEICTAKVTGSISLKKGENNAVFRASGDYPQATRVRVTTILTGERIK